MKISLLIALLAGAALLTGCSTTNPYYDAAQPHHRPDGFNNTYIDNWAADQPSFWRWQRQRLLAPPPASDSARVPVASPDLAYLQRNRQDVSVTWIGHSTALRQINGLNILTDPHFSERTSPVSFAGPKLDWWQSVDVAAPGGSVALHLVRVQHWSSRSPWDRNATLWGGFVLTAQVGGSPYQMFCSGDSGHSKDFADIHARFGDFDFAQIAVGCCLPRWFMQTQHINEEEAVRIHPDLNSKLSMGVHWGTPGCVKT